MISINLMQLHFLSISFQFLAPFLHSCSLTFQSRRNCHILSTIIPRYEIWNQKNQKPRHNYNILRLKQTNEEPIQNSSILRLNQKNENHILISNILRLNQKNAKHIQKSDILRVNRKMNKLPTIESAIFKTASENQKIETKSN